MAGSRGLWHGGRAGVAGGGTTEPRRRPQGAARPLRRLVPLAGPNGRDARGPLLGAGRAQPARLPALGRRLLLLRCPAGGGSRLRRPLRAGGHRPGRASPCRGGSEGRSDSVGSGAWPRPGGTQTSEAAASPGTNETSATSCSLKWRPLLLAAQEVRALARGHLAFSARALARPGPNKAELATASHSRETAFPELATSSRATVNNWLPTLTSGVAASRSRENVPVVRERGEVEDEIWKFKGNGGH